MPTSYPSNLDQLTNPTASDSQVAISHSAQHANANDAIEALQTKVGVDSSSDTNSIDYKLTTHIANTSNPHSVTAAQVGKDTAQWNADKIQGKEVDNTGLADNTVLTYDAISGKLVYEIPAAGAVTSVNGQTGAVSLSTADIPESTDNNYVSDAQLVVIGNTSGTNTGDQNLSGYFNKSADDLDDITDGTTYKKFSATEQTKLAGIEAGAEVNVNADWNAVSGDAQILNKPTIPTQYTDEMAQDAVGGMVDTSLTYTDATPQLKVTNPVTPQTTGFTITAGTTPKTLTVANDASVSGTNTGDQDLSGLIAKTTNITALNETGIADGEIAVFNLTNKDIRTSDKTITTTLGADDTTIPTSKAVKDVTDTKITGFADPNADRIVFWDDSAGAYAALQASTGLTISTTSMTVRSASSTQTGIIEIATDAETVTGTDTARATTPANITARLASPSAIGSTAPSTGKFTSLETTGNIELGSASDTTISRVSAGVVAIEGSNIITASTVPTKASGAELDTGTDDAKFATAKALKDSHNVPSVAPSTSGNVLTSNGTDWVSSAPPVSVSVTTKGDLQTYSTTPDRLPVGTNNQVLTADSTTATGLKWADPAASGSVATDAIWDAKGDLAVGTGANTASRLAVGTDGYILESRASEATGLKWVAPIGVNSLVSSEVPSGSVNSSNVTFTLASTPTAGTVRLYQNGVRLKVTEDYTISGDTITMNTAPVTGDLLLADYQTNSTVSGNADTLDGQHAPTGTIVGTSDTQTLTNKTLTSPKLNENVAVTTTATELNNLNGKTFNLGAWTSFTPTISNLTLGTGGTKTGVYCQIGKTIHFRVKVVFGTSGAITGTPVLTLPVTALVTNTDVIGLTQYTDTGTAGYVGWIDSLGGLRISTTSGSYSGFASLSATVPHTWANTDVIEINGTYEAA